MEAVTMGELLWIIRCVDLHDWTGMYVGFWDWLYIREAVNQILVLLGPLLLLCFLDYYWASSVWSFESDLEMIGFLRCLFR